MGGGVCLKKYKFKKVFEKCLDSYIDMKVVLFSKLVSKVTVHSSTSYLITEESRGRTATAQNCLIESL